MISGEVFEQLISDLAEERDDARDARARWRNLYLQMRNERDKLLDDEVMRKSSTSSLEAEIVTLRAGIKSQPEWLDMVDDNEKLRALVMELQNRLFDFTCGSDY